MNASASGDAFTCDDSDELAEKMIAAATRYAGLKAVAVACLARPAPYAEQAAQRIPDGLWQSPSLDTSRRV